MAESADHHSACQAQMHAEIIMEGYETDCWGCGQHLHLAVFTSMFKCAWCGAITIVQPYTKRRSKWNLRILRMRDRLLAVAVLVLIVAIVVEYGRLFQSFPLRTNPGDSLGKCW
eukprot:TRINITY_DN2395_c0_g1_i1.p1 TRINITY_DN2395_c0_g1~~TRINITY_DN2395_c0_g1_i1.p1  ORF type:complete len:132 (-),score=6.15 TRINITY_DN2395_c0_g1_i1:95-436(-)